MTANPPAATGWSDAELAHNPHANADKAAKVRGMFSAIAPSYDLNNRVHSLWRDQAWRRAAIRAANVKPGERVLDVACGTGDLTELFANTPASHVVGGDFTPAMLDVARARLASLSEARRAKVTYTDADATALAFPDQSFDVVSIAFGLRNVTDPAKAIREFVRVLKPGGRLVILEFERPRFFLARWFYDFYCGSIMPRTATLISGDRSGAYRYLPRSVGTFLSREQLLDLMRDSGLSRTSGNGLTMGICVCYRGEKPPADSDSRAVPRL